LFSNTAQLLHTDYITVLTYFGPGIYSGSIWEWKYVSYSETV